MGANYIYGGPDGRRFESGDTFDCGNGYKYRYDFNNSVVITTHSEGPTHVIRTILTGDFAFSNGKITGSIQRATQFDYYSPSDTAQADENAWSLNIPGVSWDNYAAFGVQENADSANYFYSSDAYVYKGAKFNSTQTITDRGALNGQLDTEYAGSGWWNDPFNFKSDSSPQNISGTAKTADLPAFTHSPAFGKENADMITNFNPKEKDKPQIQLSQFGADAAGTFKVAKNAKALTKALASTTDFVYLKSSGELYYNENGAAAGFGIGGVFAVIGGNPVIKAANIGFI